METLLIEGFTGRELPARWAFLASAIAHWGYGSSASGYDLKAIANFYA